MGILSEAFTTVVDVQRNLDGKIWDYNTQKYIAPTTASLAAADTAITATLGAMCDLVPFPIAASVFGLVNINITRTAFDASLAKVQAAVKAYVAATRVNM
jgi:hypothetical protein